MGRNIARLSALFRCSKKLVEEVSVLFNTCEPLQERYPLKINHVRYFIGFIEDLEYP